MDDEDPPGSVTAAAARIDFDGVRPRTSERRRLAVETPIAFAFGGVPYAVMMATPCDLEDFAHGFALTEGVVDSIGEIRSVVSRPVAEGIEIQVALVGERLARHLARQRAMSGRTGCGLCGIADLQSLPRGARVASRPPEISAAAIGSAVRALDASQPLNAATRAVHAAGFADAQGRIALLREDVGRHNALDKLIGALARRSAPVASGFIVITSRCSFEMVEKAAAGGIGVLVALSAPTSLAIERAQARGMTLIAVARSDSGLAFTIAGEPP